MNWSNCILTSTWMQSRISKTRLKLGKNCSNFLNSILKHVVTGWENSWIETSLLQIKNNQAETGCRRKERAASLSRREGKIILHSYYDNLKKKKKTHGRTIWKEWIRVSGHSQLLRNKRSAIGRKKKLLYLPDDRVAGWCRILNGKRKHFMWGHVKLMLK